MAGIGKVPLKGVASIQASGAVLIVGNVYDAMGRPPYLRVVYSNDSSLIGLLPTFEPLEDARIVETTGRTAVRIFIITVFKELNRELPAAPVYCPFKRYAGNKWAFDISVLRLMED